MNKGTKSLAIRYNLTRDDIIKAKAEAKATIFPDEHAKKIEQNANHIIPPDKPKLHKEKVSENGDMEAELISLQPMSREQIEAYFKIDKISTTLSNYWNKATAGGMFLVSAFVKCHHNNFYTESELKSKIREMLVDVQPIKPVPANSPTERLCILYLADEHVGAINHEDDLHGNFYSEEIYLNRLEQAIVKVTNLPYTFDKLLVVNLGDEADSQLNGMTTRGGHSLPTQSGKKQFDTFVKGRRRLFESIFSSGAAKEYGIINCNDSNHSGNYLSYIWNSAVGLWLEARFPDVKMTNITKFIDYIEYGNHVIAFAHGKDSKDMFKNWPLTINDKLDSWLAQYYDRLGFSASKRWIHTRKADLHQLAVSRGKVGDYISMPSLYGSSSWIGINFGQSEPGAYIEIFEKGSRDVMGIPIWFN
jgi:hypothetical protein